MRILSTLRRIADLRDEELAATGWSFAWFFCLLFSYYIVRPVRETMATAVGSNMLDRLFLAVFLVMIAAVPAYSYLVAHVRRSRFVHTVFRFFAAWLIGFSIAIYYCDGPNFWIGCTFFVWVSVFNLFAVSVFWSVLVDLFSSEQGKRLFGLIAAGGSLGGLCSSLLVGRIADSVGIDGLLMIPVVAMECSLYFYRALERSLVSATMSATDTPMSQADGSGTGGSAWKGMIHVFRSPYLFGICFFLLLGKFCATTVYLHEIAVVEREISDVERRTALFAYENGAVQALTLVCQGVFAGHIMRITGIPFTLVLLPLALTVGLFGIACWPSLAMVVGVQVLSRAMTFGIAEPAKAVLFTVVNREDKYKSKSFIDTVIFRGGDVAASNLDRFLKLVMRGSVNTALVMVPVAIVWGVLGWSLGKQQNRLASQVTNDRTDQG